MFKKLWCEIKTIENGYLWTEPPVIMLNASTSSRLNKIVFNVIVFLFYVSVKIGCEKLIKAYIPFCCLVLLSLVSVKSLGFSFECVHFTNTKPNQTKRQM